MSLKNLVNKLGLDKYIIFKGEIDDEAKKNEYLKNSDIYLFLMLIVEHMVYPN